MIRKFQQGGQQQDALMQFVQGLAQTLQVDPQQIVQIAQQNPEALQQAAQVYQQTNDMNQAAQTFAQNVQKNARKAAHGAKLNYIKSLKHQCADDEELVYFKKGGAFDCGCQKKKDGGKTPLTKKKNSAIEEFKNRKQTPYRKAEKDCGGSKLKLAKKGGEVCPKCGKVHKAGAGCSAVDLFKNRNK